MSDKQKIRPLTREEQLIWEISFLENSIKQQKEELKDCKKELIKIKNIIIKYEIILGLNRKGSDKE